MALTQWQLKPVATETTIASGDFLAFTDEDEAGDPINKITIDNLATFLAGTNITASAGVLSGTADTNTTYSGGTNLTLSTTTFNVDDAFLVNNASDVTTGTVTMAHLIVGDAGNIGSASDTDAIAISSGGVVTFSQQAVFSKDILIDSSLASNGDYSGITASFTAGEALVVGECVYLKAADSRVWKAVSVTSGTGLISAEIMCIGVVAADQGTPGSAVTVLLQGFIRSTNFPTYAVGETLYVPEAEHSSNNVPEGASPDSTGDFVQVLGWAVTTGAIYVNPDFTIIEHA